VRIVKSIDYPASNK